MYSRRPVYLASLVAGTAALLFGLFAPRDGLLRIPCGFKSLTGFPCPFCGTTRAFLQAGDARWADAWRESPLGLLLFPALLVLVIWSAWRLWRSRREPPPLEPLRIPAWLVIAASAAVAANWIYRLTAGLK